MGKMIPLGDKTEAEVSPFTISISQRNMMGTLHHVCLSKKDFILLVRESGWLAEMSVEEPSQKDPNGRRKEKNH